MQNFFDCIRGREKQLNADCTAGHLAATLVHLANASYRMGRTLNFDPVKEEVIGDKEANRLLCEADRGYRKGFNGKGRRNRMRRCDI